MSYTVKALAEMAGVTVRTLHYYDEIGLLPPTQVGENRYRYYDADALFRLQQILLFREMDLSLKEIGRILDRPDFDLPAALEKQRATIKAQIRRLNGLIRTIDNTLLHLTGEVEMSEKKLFAGFTEEEEAAYAEEARARWGAEQVDASYRRWNSFTPEQQEMIKQEGVAIYRDLAALVGKDPDDPAVQAVVGRWHRHLGFFTETSSTYLRGLASLYNEHPDFQANFQELHPDLPAFMQAAIAVYCDGLEEGE